MSTSPLRSSELAGLAGTTPRALRHYHQLGLLPEVPRDPNGYRRYTVRDLVRVLRIRQLAAGGMPLNQISAALEGDLRNQDQMLAELDRSLEEESLRISRQRKAVAQLRAPLRVYGDVQGSKTRQFDQELWALLSASGGIDEAAQESVLNALENEAVPLGAQEWFAEFEALEDHTHIDDESADQLARTIVRFAHAIGNNLGLEPLPDDSIVMPLVDQVSSESLSLAQQEVWRRVAAFVGD